jgi:uncharacterized Zn-finger protein
MPRKRISCSYEGCCRSYCSSFNLKRHVESSHFGIRKFKCQVCAKYLSSKQNLLDHQNIHSGAKPYKCDIGDCNQCFRQLSQFYLHKQLHNEVYVHISKNSTILDATLKYLATQITQDPIKNYIIPKVVYSGPVLPKIYAAQYPIKLPMCESLLNYQN